MEVARTTEVWRARGIGQFPASAPTCADRADAENYARWIVMEEVNSNTEVAVQRFDLPTQTWVTEGIVARKKK